jgi:general secretion pathway protein J
MPRITFQQAGFTLIEVIVSIAIFSILSVGCYRIVNGVISAKERIVYHSENLSEISKAIRILESDFQQIVDRKIIEENGNLLSAYHADINSFNNSGKVVEFSRIGYRNPLFVKRAGVVRIALGHEDATYFEEEKDISDSTNKEGESLGYIWRYVYPVLDRGNNQEPEKQLLMRGVTEFIFEYLDKDNNWSDVWRPLDNASNQTTDIPYAIKFKITMKNGFYIERLFSMRPLPL